MLFQVTPDTHALLCLLIMAVAFIVAQWIALQEPAPAPAQERRRAPRRRAKSRARLRVIRPQRVHASDCLTHRPSA
ncbi:MAG: hypothetical protein AB2385_09180 [Symbiobacterium sp.]|uniref:hypothetical protein n=1 Tax=Symbiobacterium sp. TaxID=1971213 RepID=UPI00346408F4